MSTNQAQKRCGRCRQDKPLAAFHKERRNRDGLSNRCKDCNLKQLQEWRKANPRKHWNAELKRRYGITIEQYDAMLITQGGGCGICGSTEPGRKGNGWFAVDHDHSCCAVTSGHAGCVRGLLCSQCNTILASAGDDEARLRKAIQYLRRTRRF